MFKYAIHKYIKLNINFQYIYRTRFTQMTTVIFPYRGTPFLYIFLNVITDPCVSSLYFSTALLVNKYIHQAWGKEMRHLGSSK